MPATDGIAIVTVLSSRTSPGAEDLPVPFRVSGALATGSVLQPLNSSMIAVAIVGIAAQFGSASGVSWVISAMYITTAVGAPTAGRMGSLFGARRVFVGGLLLVAVGSIVGMLAPSVGWLIAAYVLLGIGISAHMPNAMTMIRSYAERYGGQSRTALTTLVVCGQSVAALGPTIGGLLVGAFGWHSILWVNLPVVLLSAIAVMRADVGFAGGRSASASEALRALDVMGIVFFLVAITSLMLLLVSFRDRPLWWLLPVAGMGSALFVWWEMRAPQPFFDVRALVRNRALSNTLVRTMVTYTCFYCVFFGIPQWLQYVRGMSAIEAGLTMLPVAGVSVVATIAGSRLYRRAGARATLLVGSVALLVGGILIVSVERSTAPLLVLLLVAAVLGIPNGFNNIGNQSLVNAVSSVEEVGTAIGMFRTMAFIGANLSVVVLQVTAGNSIDDDEGLHRIGWFIVAAAAVLVAGIVFSRHMGPKGKVGGADTGHSSG
ncbi:putative MFS family arabinose efflux permease [Rhodococcus rhodochrous J45]|uniref:Putative MFS family arabinose efflux permease n=1 Tax=Rhodococcus rhodochrous J45 TaxID=935266 RepID=A0A562DIP1_RHORH|nr:MFS transporter [Rhodococcus rhodochrous]TWH09404.1 putative MFS family arabinose efflux permease [Rhodococcus rhodochrous J45]